MNENLVLELINTHKVTNKLLKKQIVFKRMMTILSFVFIVVSVIFLISFMSYSAKIDTLNENLTKIHIYENSEQKETASDNNAIEQPITEEITYEIVLVESTEEQIQSFESGKDIKFKNTVFGQIADKKDGVLVVNAKVIKSEEKIFLSDNPHTEIVLGQECEFKVDEVTIKGYLKEKE